MVGAIGFDPVTTHPRNFKVFSIFFEKRQVSNSPRFCCRDVGRFDVPFPKKIGKALSTPHQILFLQEDEI